MARLRAGSTIRKLTGGGKCGAAMVSYDRFKKHFEKGPIRLGPNSTGAEFAAVVATMPMADQHAIRTMVREIVQERDQ
jgi:hypothetical protein